MVLELSLLCEHSTVYWILRFVNLKLEEEVDIMMFSRTWNLTSQWKQQHAHTESLFLTAGDKNAVHSRLGFPQFFKTAPRKDSFEITSQEERRKNNFQLFSYFSGTFSWNTKAKNYIFWEQLFCENNVIFIKFTCNF